MLSRTARMLHPRACGWQGHSGRRELPGGHGQWGTVGISRRPGAVTTRRDYNARPLVDRNFIIDHLNRLWASDIKYVTTAAAFLDLAVVLNEFSRRMDDRVMATHLRTGLVLVAIR